MKKILTLVLALSTLTTVFAVESSNSPIKIIATDHGTFSFSERERDEQILTIRRDYENGIRELKSSRGLSCRDEGWQVGNLEIKRDRKIRRVNEKFYNSNNTSYRKMNSKREQQ
ncbi:hypothetical protein V9K67_15205 [Paraflavisolibacter sp. H34]|uniref:hypothetical protein n=1 Tax=Huijunlia imazamoxiresistens TaxID=3127457 RepID=UPI0030171706